MNLGKTLFSQLMEFVPWTSFARIVARYSGDARVSRRALKKGVCRASDIKVSFARAGSILLRIFLYPSLAPP